MLHKTKSVVSRLIYFLLLLSLFVSIATESKTVPEFKKWKKGENLIENSGFEDGKTAWDLEDGACCDRGGKYEWEVEKKEVQNGKRAMKIIGVKATGTDWHAKIKHKSTSMQAGKNFTVAFWAKAEKAREVGLSIQMRHDPWTAYQGGKFTLNTEWKEYSKTFKAASDVDRDMWVGLCIAQSDIDFWLDNVRFFEGELRDEIGRDPKDLAVSSSGKLLLAWSQIKANF